MQDQFSRTRMIFKRSGIEKLQQSKVAVFGLGGVGGYVVEVLARSGVGHLSIFDDDVVCLTNLNRQIFALHSTLGKNKVDIAVERIKDINPNCEVDARQMFYLPENADEIDLTSFDYVVDCIDTMAAKMELIKRCTALNVPLLSCMGAANKVDPTAFSVCDITKTKMDPLAKIIRKKLRKIGIKHLKVFASDEKPMEPFFDEAEVETQSTDNADTIVSNHHDKKVTPASNAFVPAVAGIIAGGEVVKDLLRIGVEETE